MTAYLARRLIQSVPLLLIISFIAFAIVQATGDPLAAYTVDASLTSDDIARLRARYGLDRPMPLQYLSWLGGALRWDFGKLRVPAYLIGGLLDGYRDAPLRILEHATGPLKVEIGPWNHAWPNDGEPGPNYEWGYEATRWWDRWLKGRNTGISDGKQLASGSWDGDVRVWEVPTGKPLSAIKPFKLEATKP